MMSQYGLPGKSVNRPAELLDEIPEAVRENIDEVQSPQKWLLPLPLLAGLGVLLTIGAITAFQLGRSRSPMGTTSSNSVTTNTTNSSPAIAADGSVLGHYPYQEARPEDLQPISSDGQMRLSASAAQAFKEMMAAAQAEGVSIVPLSAFRSLQDQKELFFEVKKERVQTAQERAGVSAPPGYSEHHTGYAIDVGDSNVPAVNLSPDFETTPSFKWLQANAPRFSFEISFPKDNVQGVSYEPWHWRYVGDSASLETFYKARNIKPIR